MTNSPLAHLDAKAQQRLMDRYYAGDKVAVLLKEFGVACSPKRLVHHFPPEITHLSCRVCGASLLRPREVREIRRGRRTSRPLRCTRCPHVETLICDCPSCQQARRQVDGKVEEQRAIARLCEDYREQAVSDIQPEALTADAAFGLLTLVRCTGWRTSKTLGSLRAAPISFGSLENRYLCDPLVTALVDQHVAAPSPTSSREAFGRDAQGEWTWDVNQVDWTLLLADPRGFMRQLERVVVSSDWPDGWEGDINQRWRELAFSECVERYLQVMMEYRLPRGLTVGLLTLIGHLLDDFSLGQCMQLFVTSAREMDRDVRQGTVQEIGDHFVRRCQRKADQLRGKNVPSFVEDHPPLFERAQVSYVLHDLFLKHGDEGRWQMVLPPSDQGWDPVWFASVEQGCGDPL